MVSIFPSRLDRGLLCGFGLVAFVVLLPQTVDAASDIGSDSLSAAGVAFTLQYAPPPSCDTTRIRWLRRDKIQHTAFSGLWTLSTQYVLVSKAGWTEADALSLAAASGALIGGAKEVYDASQSSRDASVADLAANGVGIGVALAIILL